MLCKIHVDRFFLSNEVIWQPDFGKKIRNMVLKLKT